MTLGDRINVQLPDFSGFLQRASDLVPSFGQRGGGVQAPNFGGNNQVQAPGFQTQYGPPPSFGTQGVAAPSFASAGFNAPNFGLGSVGAPNFQIQPVSWPGMQNKPAPGMTGPNSQNGSTGGNWGGAATSDDNAGLSAEQVDAWIAKTRPGSPLAGMGKFIIDTANQYGVSAPLMLGIMLKESGLGTNVGAGNLTGITDPSRDQGLGGQRAFANTGGWQESVVATAQNLATSTYKGKSIAEQIGNWYVGPQEYAAHGLAATDKAGNGTVQDYVNLVMGVYSALGRQANPTQAGTLKGAAGGVIAAGAKLLGTPYLLGGLRTHPNDPRLGIDCSEFTAYAYQQMGVSLPWNAQAQFNATQRIDKSQLQVGDLVFFTNTYDAGETVTHVGIFAGYQNGHPVMLNSSNDGVSYQQLDSPYWSSHYYGAGRVAQH